MITTNLDELARGVNGGAVRARSRRARVSPPIGMPSVLAYLARTDGERGERLACDVDAARVPTSTRWARCSSSWRC